MNSKIHNFKKSQHLFELFIKSNFIQLSSVSSFSIPAYFGEFWTVVCLCQFIESSSIYMYLSSQSMMSLFNPKCVSFQLKSIPGLHHIQRRLKTSSSNHVWLGLCVHDDEERAQRHDRESRNFSCTVSWENYI